MEKTFKREKIGSGYFRCGHNRTSPRNSSIYLIDGYTYAKDSQTARTDSPKLSGELEGYVRVNFISDSFSVKFSQVSEYEHTPYLKATS